MLASKALDDAVQLADPAFHEDPWEVYAQLQAQDPVHYCRDLDLWLLTQHADVRYVGRTPELFSNRDGILLNDVLYRDRVLASFFPRSKVISTLDPPEHRQLRANIAPAFVPRMAKRLEPEVRQWCRELLDTFTPGEPFELVSSLSSLLPLFGIARLLGIPADVDQLRAWSGLTMRMGYKLSRDELAQTVADLEPMREFFREYAQRKLDHPEDDLISVLSQKTADGLLTPDDLIMLLSAVLQAGNETTRELITGGIVAFAENPEQWDRVIQDPGLAARAVDESLRWVSPVRGFVRLVVSDTELNGANLTAGQYVYLSYAAANRDPEVFPEPHQFDVARVQDPMHIAFGWGEHVCPGSNVARTEAGALFEEIATRGWRPTIAGAVEKSQNLLHNSWKAVSIAFEN
jgi:cytochrome P450